jgi:hypothetical protein
MRAIDKLVLVLALAAAASCASLPRGSTTAQHDPAIQARPPAVTASFEAQAGGAAEQDEPHIQPDRPDVTNSTYTVPKHLVQLETGGRLGRVPVAGESIGTPVSFRIGLMDRFEARLETEGATRQRADGESAWQFGGLAAGAKVRLWNAPGGLPAFAIEPSVTLPMGRGADGGTDFSAIFLVSEDLPGNAHIDLNYAVAAIAAAQSHFAEHLLSASANVQVGARWSPYVEVYWLSRLEPRGPRVVSMDAGAIYTVNERVAVDGGVLCGLAASDARPAVFGGLSVILGEVAGRKGIHARLREAQRGGDR